LLNQSTNFNQKNIAFIVIILTFLHGIFSTGFMPILNKELGLESSLPFALYFLGILLGQGFIYKYIKLSYTLKLFFIYEMLFGFSLIFMVVFNTKLGFSTGRLLEGLFAGLSTPLLFSLIINLKDISTESKRLAVFNSLTAIGFVLGPLVISELMFYFSYKICLMIFAFIFISISIIFSFYKTPDPDVSLNENTTLKRIFKNKDSFEKFFTMFLAKSFYGFLITSIPSFLLVYINEQISISKIILIAAFIFVIGQVIIESIIKKFPKEHLENYLPVFLALSLILFFYTKSINFIYLAAFIHSMLAFLGYLNFSFKINSLREFAFFNLVSDPGMVIGAFLATTGVSGIWIIVLLMFIPIIRTILISEHYTRAEKLIPFIGIITLYKIFKKHRNPNLLAEEDILKDYKFDSIDNNYNFENKVLIAFTGDFCPSNYKYQLSEDIKDLLYIHDLRIINLEGLSTSNNKSNLSHRISDNLFENIVYSNNNQNFNLISFVNNHVLDLGTDSYDKNINEFKSKNIESFSSDLFIKEVNGIKIGFFALTFSNNFFWRNNKLVKTIKPEEILYNIKKQKKIQDLIKSFKERVDLLVLSYHWGYESEYFPSKTQKDCFEILNNFGIDILYGHHSHIIQGFELNNNVDKNDSLCLYSCGNFINDPEMPEKIYTQGIIYSIEIQRNNDTLKINKIKPYFTEIKDKENNLKEISLINKKESLSYNNWIKCNKL
jgi:poly-gamma-glutamate capsule biosynthesis protein CapA/YwtB (metallophosphatase superfamily)/MFS family permease